MVSFPVPSQVGESRVSVYPAADAAAVLLLGHGAGGGITAFDLVTLAENLPGRGVTVLLHEQPWKVAGKRVAPRPATLDQAWHAVLDAVVARYPRLPLWVGGRSAGARVACRCFDHRQAGVVCLAFPLHPPGKPESSRIAELAGVTGPVLVVQGTSDPFGSPDDVRAAVREAGGVPADVLAVPGGHSFGPRSRAAQAAAPALRRTIADAVAGFVLR